jgi:hypothetical protein
MIVLAGGWQPQWGAELRSSTAQVTVRKAQVCQWNGNVIPYLPGVQALNALASSIQVVHSASSAGDWHLLA